MDEDVSTGLPLEMAVSLLAPRTPIAPESDGEAAPLAEPEPKPTRKRPSPKPKSTANDLPQGKRTGAKSPRSTKSAADETAAKSVGDSAADKPAPTPAPKGVHAYAREAAALLLIASALYISLALASFKADPLRIEVTGADWVGPVGAAFAGLLVETVGACAWLVPLDLALFATPLLQGRPAKVTFPRIAGDLVVLVVVSALLHVAFPKTTAFGAMPLGGTSGELFGEVMRALFSTLGSYIVGLTVVSLILIGRAAFSIIDWAQRAERRARALGEKGHGGLRALVGAWDQARALDEQRREEERKASEPVITEACDEAIFAALGDESPMPFPRVKPVLPAKAKAAPLVVNNERAAFAAPAAIAPTIAIASPSLASPSLVAAPKVAAPIAIATPPVNVPSIAAAFPEPPLADADAERRARAEAPTPSPVVAAAAPEKKRGRKKNDAANNAAAPIVEAAAAPIINAMVDLAAPAVGARAPDLDLKSDEAIAFAADSGDAADLDDANAEASFVDEAAAGAFELDLTGDRNNVSRSGEAAPKAAPPLSAPPAAVRAPIAAAPAAPVAPAEAEVKIVDTSAALEAQKPSILVKIVPAIGEGFRLPSPSLLDEAPGGRVHIDEDQLKQTAVQLEKVLADYGVNGKVEEIHPGPTVTTFEVSPAAGTKVSKVASLADDLALGLSRKVRIVAPIPGKNRIGFEIPNERRMPVVMRELVEDKRFLDMKAPLPCVLGRDIIGAPYFADLASMPHVIVAGATGAGKSVGLNVMLVSLLYRRTPAELRLLMIDPKVVELAPFDGIPHMLLPVVTDMKQASNALKWAVDEMERRYQLFANAGTRNITTYNGWAERVRKGEIKAPKKALPKTVTAVAPDGTDVDIPASADDPELPETLPWILIVVDEFADLMMQQGKDVEASVARLAQKARAAGMHVILATQRPSVDVITGMIKANFPTRIAFRVAQKVDSRTILDEQGAEHLLGRGDMLVKMNGSNDTRRVQCPFCSEEEVQRVTDFLRLQGSPVYDENILKPRDEDGEGGDVADDELDAMYDAAVRVVADTRRCSTSWLQRKLGIGYNRAAKIVEAMEKRGVVGPANGAKDREVLIGSI
ncbi:MAG: DNA translocase FtsK 4TM domain-containing protein [Polyangiaceae bacterium]|nr:DNA translocase FtsK 4TM domain-containing protein [Polyangiaceae bacterium]